MARLVLLILFALGVIVAYVVGIKGNRAWGKPLLILCLVGLIAVVLQRAFIGRARLAERADIDRPAQDSAMLLAQGIKGEVRPGSRIFFFSPIPPVIPTQMARYWMLWEKGVNEGLGSTAWQKVHIARPADNTAAAFSESLLGREGEVDVVLSFVGLPDDLPQMVVYSWAVPPTVAACFPYGADRARVRQWLQEGLIRAAVIQDGGSMKLYTPGQPP